MDQFTFLETSLVGLVHNADTDVGLVGKVSAEGECLGSIVSLPLGIRAVY